MKDLYQASQYTSFREACAEAKSISAKNSFSVVVRRSRADPGCWDVLVPQPIEGLQGDLEDEPLESLENEEELYEEALRDYEHEEQRWQEEQDWIADLERREMLADIHSDQEDWGRLDDEGWFYED